MKASRAYGFVPSRGFPQACTRTRSRGHLGTDSARFKLPPLYVPVSLSRMKLAMICGARSALRRWSCSNCERRCERNHCIRKYSGRFNHVTTFVSPTFQTYKDEKAEMGVSDQRGWRKTAELHTSGAKQAETWRGGVKW